MDNFAFLAQELKVLGYACSAPNAEPYVPLKERSGSYSDRLMQSQWSFAPKGGWKRGKSTARQACLGRLGPTIGMPCHALEGLAIDPRPS